MRAAFYERVGTAREYQQSTFAAHFAEVAVDSNTAEIRIRRTLCVCASGRILNPKTARSQVIGAMTQGVGAALMEELAVDKRIGFFANHDLAGYEVPVHADIPHQDVIFRDDPDAVSSQMKAKGVAELGICGAAAAVANAVYNATGVRTRDYPMTLDKLLNDSALRPSNLLISGHCEWPAALKVRTCAAPMAGGAAGPADVSNGCSGVVAVSLRRPVWVGKRQ